MSLILLFNQAVAQSVNLTGLPTEEAFGTMHVSLLVNINTRMRILTSMHLATPSSLASLNTTAQQLTYLRLKEILLSPGAQGRMRLTGKPLALLKAIQKQETTMRLRYRPLLASGNAAVVINSLAEIKLEAAPTASMKLAIYNLGSDFDLDAPTGKIAVETTPLANIRLNAYPVLR